MNGVDRLFWFNDFVAKCNIVIFEFMGIHFCEIFHHLMILGSYILYIN